MWVLFGCGFFLKGDDNDFARAKKAPVKIREGREQKKKYGRIKRENIANEK